MTNTTLIGRATHVDLLGQRVLLLSPCCQEALRLADDDGPYAGSAMCRCCERIFDEDELADLEEALCDREGIAVDYADQLLAFLRGETHIAVVPDLHALPACQAVA